MERRRWQRLQDLYAEATARPAAARDDFVADACGGDEALAAELRALLRAEVDAVDPAAAALERAASGWAAGLRHGLIGRRLGPWRISAHLADGGMGAVFRAERADGQYVQDAAIKLLNPALVSEDARARLHAERQILARLAHPHIARLLDGGRTDDGAPYLVMEFVDGEPIDAWCDHHGLDTEARLRLFVQVCRAVDHAHRSLVVHRDLKPSNILVDTHGVPRLLDFGIARLIDAEGLTRSGERLLTPSHASPEQITGGPVTTATDVYALGVLLYDLLVGRLPHADTTGNPAALARAIVETEPPRPSAAVTQGSSRRLQAAATRGAALTPARLARELRGDLDNIVLMALRKEPGRRYASAEALAEDVERFLAHRPVRARADTAAYRSAKFMRRHPVAVPASAAAIAIVLAGAAAFTWRLADERDRALAAERAARRTADFTATLLEGTQAEEGAARTVSVRELLDKAAARIDAELQAEPEVAGRLRSALGRALHSWSAYDEARQQHERALALLRGVSATPRRETARVLSSLSDITHDLGDLDASLDFARQAEAEWRQVGDAAERAEALLLVGASFNAMRRHAEAEPYLIEALATLRRVHAGRDDDGLANAIFYLAYNRYSQMRLDEALPLYEESLAMRRRLAAGDAKIGELLRHVALVQHERGDLEAGERAAREALERLTAVYGEGGHALVSGSQRLLAGFLLDRGQYDEAVKLTAEALATDTRLMGEKHRWTASSMQWHGTALLRVGRLDEAERLIRRSNEVRREVLPAGHPDRVNALMAWSRVDMARGHTDQAEARLREALAIARALDNPGRTPIEDVLFELGRLQAAKGQRAEGRALAAEGAALRPAGHWLRRVAEARLALPPFVDAPTASARAAAEQLRDEMRERLGPAAPLVRELDEALGRAG